MTATPLDLILGETVTATTAIGTTRTGRYLGYQPKANTAVTGTREYEAIVAWDGDDFDSIVPLNRLAPVDVAAILATVAATLRTEPRRILTSPRLTTLVLAAAGPAVTETQLRPVWEVLPGHPDGNEHAEYAALITMVARDL